MDHRVLSWHEVFARILRSGHLARAEQLLALVNDATAGVGVRVRLYLVDLAQRQLHPLGETAGPSLVVDTTVAGRAFSRLEIVVVPAEGDAPAQLWMPLLDGTERLGVVHAALPAGADPHDSWLREQCWLLAGLVAHLMVSKQSYSDLCHTVRRTKPLSVAAELLWQLMPPQTFACDRLVVTAVLEPYDEVGGDGYDYAVDADRAYVGVFDAVGHDMHAGLTTAVALAATRNARRRGMDLVAAATAADQAIGEQTEPNEKLLFASAVLAHLDLDTGMLTYLNAGYPPPVLLREGRITKLLPGPTRPPLGLGHLTPAAPRPGQERLQPGDRILFYSDGVTEARNPEREEFGLDRLIELTEHHEAAGLPAPETLRRITRAVLDHQNGTLQDDATLLLLEWTTAGQQALLPTL
jgi:hypothetical protein